MLQRRAMQELERWKGLHTQQGLLISGARQVGKTTLVREFGSKNYDVVAEVNFLETPLASQTVSEAVNTEDLLLRISALSRSEFKDGSTLIFLDEVQECKDLLTWVKFLKEQSNYDFVLSGSMLGVDLYNVRSFPVGFIQPLIMYPLGFEEFCWACGVPKMVFQTMKDCVRERIEVPGYVHEQLIDLFYKYLMVGGMPDAVNAFLRDKNLPGVRNVQQAIISAYELDITKYVPDELERRHVKTIYESIPAQLNATNKRFKFIKMGKGSRFAHMATAFDWLEKAGIALPTIKVTDPQYPLGLSADISSFKLFFNDIGLLTSTLMGEADLDILNRRSGMNYGSFFENVVAQELQLQGRELFYYNKAGIGEIDFLVQNRAGGVSLLEVKSGKDYKRHNAMNNLLATENYCFEHPIVLYDGNVQCKGQVEYLPIYAISVLDAVGV